jgi:hypothetical protein
MSQFSSYHGRLDVHDSCGRKQDFLLGHVVLVLGEILQVTEVNSRTHVRTSKERELRCVFVA